MQELKLSASGSPEETTDKEKGAKKRSGCGCALMGCVVLILLVLTPVVGGFVYLATLSEADYGHFLVSVLKQKDFAKGIKESINDNPKMTPEERQSLIATYDTFLDNYDKLSPEARAKIDTGIIVVLKKAVEDPDGFAANPPQELLDIMTLLGVDGLKELRMQAPPPQSAPTQPQTPAPAPSGDPYQFDLPQTPKPQEPAAEPEPQFDF